MNIHHFFTLWVILLMVFYKYTLAWFDLYYLVIIVFCIGSYVSFVDPQYYIADIFDREYKFEGLPRLCCVDMIHFLMLLIVICNPRFVNNRSIFKTYNSILLVLVYLIMIDPIKVYRSERWHTMYILGLAITILYLLFLK